MNSKNIEILQYKNQIVSTINRLMYNRNWSIKTLSEQASLPYESVKKIVGGKINNPTIYSLIKISEAFGCGLNYLLDDKSPISSNSLNLPKRAFSLISEIAKFESYLNKHNTTNGTNFISVMVPTGRCEDGMHFDSISTECIDISSLDSSIQDIVLCGIKIVGNALQPTYFDDDVLLVTKDRFPLTEEVGIFLRGNSVYIRKYIASTPAQLIPVNSKGETIFINNIDDWLFWGRVITVMRS